ncbi:hypothetical protein DL89DRAFT_289357 [Linderina pennispora]|uniref:EamA domain-containing protein n=1 Tax=Linderina pennispora TaxID=61395 RepID=A0A1Y1WJ47_9FUNG|nr:uncharacterized protein DL89DRAFT_289357 [Linderina pennispora]ORX73601.1 hypothetical protein DL89DRAFT_289357 [Linderina pennispora]
MANSYDAISERRPSQASDISDCSLGSRSRPPARPVHSMATVDPAAPSAKRSMLLGGLALSICIVSFVFQTTITRKVQESFSAPYFILWVSHTLWIVLLPMHTVFEKLKRRPRSLSALKAEVLVGCAKIVVQLKGRSSAYRPIQGSDQDREQRGGHADVQGVRRRHKLTTEDDNEEQIGQQAGLLNASAYLWYAALNFSSMSKVTAIYNMSCFFAYLFSILLLHERVRLSKCIAVGISIIGVIVMENAAALRSNELFGDLISLCCACGIGLYQVLYKKYAVPSGFHSLYPCQLHDSPAGLLHRFAIYWFPVPLLNALGIEPFHWPDREQLWFILANAFFGIAYNGAFMIALALTSPLFAAIGVMLTIPVMAVVDMVLQGQVLAWNVLLGGLGILAGFSVLTFAEYQETMRKSQEEDSSDDAGSNQTNL